MNPAARWDSLALYDKRDLQSTEFRAFAGDFLFSTGSNRHANRFTLGHFDLPLRNCTITLDGDAVIRDGRLQGDLAWFVRPPQNLPKAQTLNYEGRITYEPD